MNLHFPSSFKLRFALALLAAPALLLGGCHRDVVVIPAADTSYFPTVVGTYRAYAVADSTWANALVTVSNYQFRERVTEQYSDATGQPAYLLVRSKRLTPTDAWQDDSVFVVQAQPSYVLFTRNNLRTVELIYPARTGKAWNATAFTVGVFSPDTITNTTRAYTSSAGTAYTTPAIGSYPAKSYAATVATKSTLPGSIDDVNVYYQRGLQQVYASGVGLVLRRKFSYQTYYTDTSQGGIQVLTPGVKQQGNARYEVLVETGTI